jgi:hypothetical protein
MTRWSTAALADGCQSRTLVQRVAGADGGACSTLGRPRGGWSAVVDGDLCGRRSRCGERRLLTSLAGKLGYNRVPRDGGMMVDPILHSNDNGVGWWWCSMASRVGAEAEMSRAKGGMTWP